MPISQDSAIGHAIEARVFTPYATTGESVRHLVHRVYWGSARTRTLIPRWSKDPASQSASSGASPTLAAACAAGFDFTGPVTFRWQRNGTDVSNGPGGASGGGGTVSGASGSLTFVDTSATLPITGIRPSDAGQCTVVFANSCGTGISLPATVTVSGGCPTDLNNDAVVNGQDLAFILSGWGPCP